MVKYRAYVASMAKVGKQRTRILFGSCELSKSVAKWEVAASPRSSQTPALSNAPWSIRIPI